MKNLSIDDLYKLSLSERIDYIKSCKLAQDESSSYVEECKTDNECIKYTKGGLEYSPKGNSLDKLQSDEILLAVNSISLCGTDLNLIKKAKNNELNQNALGLIAGHEVSGIIVGIGNDVKNFYIGDVVCLDSHYSCQKHTSFNECVKSGKNCDGIVGGIRGAINENGDRDYPVNGYWGRIIKVKASALNYKLPKSLTEIFSPTSTLESLGNIYMIVNHLKKLRALDKNNSVMLITGLGATGYQLACVSKYYGLDVIGLENDSSRREFAKNTLNLVFDSFESLNSYINEESSLEDKDFILCEMSGNKQVITSGFEFLENLKNRGRKVFIAFGLVHDPSFVVKFNQEENQNEFVLSRKSLISEIGTEVYGICGRDLDAWRELIEDLSGDNDDKYKLANNLLRSIKIQTSPDPFKILTELLNGKEENFVELMNKDGVHLKLAFTL